MHCCCGLACCSALAVLFVFGGSLLVSLMCLLNAHSNADDDEELCAEGLSWLKGNVIVSVISAVAILNRQRKIVKNDKEEPLIREEAQGVCGCLEYMAAIAWFIWMITLDGFIRTMSLFFLLDEKAAGQKVASSFLWGFILILLGFQKN